MEQELKMITHHRSRNPHNRKAFRILLLLAGIAAVILLLSILTGVAPKDLPLYYADQAGITHSNSTAEASIEGYASYQSVPDQYWNAGSTTQRITLTLPETVTKTIRKNGKKITATGKNPVMASPHIYIDLDGDGKFQETECVYNRIRKDRKGNVTDYGKFLTPGHELRTVQLNRKIPAGRYNAQLLWTGLLIRTHEVANPMSFQFHITVR